MKKTMNKRTLGSKVEQLVKDYLNTHGFLILETNYRCRTGEIDLIAKEGNYYVFIEVKYRTSDAFGTPQEAVTPAKQKRICKTTLRYLYSHNQGESTPVRFDVAAVSGQKLSYFRDAFPFILS